MMGSTIPIKLSSLDCSNNDRSNSCFEGNYYCPGHFLSVEEITELKRSWSGVIGDDTGGHGINIFIMFFKSCPEMKVQYFGFLNSLSEEELRISPRLMSHASGVLLGVTQIINGLENPLVVADVANKFAQSHFVRGVKETNVRLLMSTMIQYMQITGNISQFTKDCYEKMFDHFITIVKTRSLKKNLSVMMIALIVFGIEKLIEFLTAVFRGPQPGECVCNCTEK